MNLCDAIGRVRGMSGKNGVALRLGARIGHFDDPRIQAGARDFGAGGFRLAGPGTPLGVRRHGLFQPVRAAQVEMRKAGRFEFTAKMRADGFGHFDFHVCLLNQNDALEEIVANVQDGRARHAKDERGVNFGERPCVYSCVRNREIVFFAAG